MLYVYVPAAFYGAATPEELRTALRYGTPDRPRHLWDGLEACLAAHGASWSDRDELEVRVPQAGFEGLVRDLEAMGCRVSR